MVNQIENFNPLDPGSWLYEFLKGLKNVPLIGPIVKIILDCFSWENIIVSLIPLLALFMRNGHENMLATLIVVVIFYVLSIIGGVVLQYWACSDSSNQKDKNLWDKITLAAEGTWYIPLMFTIFMFINWFIRQPYMLEFREITFIITFFIQVSFIFGIVMYFISWQNYCAFRAIAC